MRCLADVLVFVFLAVAYPPISAPVRAAAVPEASPDRLADALPDSLGR